MAKLVTIHYLPHKERGVILQDIYYNINTARSYNALFNFIVGERGNGKTYSAKKMCIKDSLKSVVENNQHTTQFIWVRRFKEELKKIKLFFEDISEEFPNIDFTVKGGKDGGMFYANDKLIGYYVPLSTSRYLKSVSLKYVDKIVFDEFLIGKGYTSYIPDEINIFLDLYSTVARLRDVKTYFIANAVDFYNPYFTYFNLRKPKNKNGVYCKDDVLLQLTNTSSYRDVARKTRFAQMLEKNNSSYLDYAFNNEFLLNNENLVKKPTGKMTISFNILHNGNYYGCWCHYETGEYYIRDVYDKNAFHTFTFNKDELKENILYYKNGSFKINNLKKKIRDGLLFFESQKIKGLLENEIIKIF